MNFCHYKHRWDFDLDLLSDEEFEELLEHTNFCIYHEQLLDKYNQDIIHLLNTSDLSNILPVIPEKLELTDSWSNPFNLKLEIAVKVLQKTIKVLKENQELAAGILLTSVLLFFGESLLIIFFGNNEELSIQISYFMIAILSVVFLTFASQIKDFLPTLKMVSSESSDSFTSFYPFKETGVMPVSRRLQTKQITPNEALISEEIREILSTGFTASNCQRCLAVLEKNKSTVQNSWIHNLNKARFLIGAGKEEDARRVIQFVSENFSHSVEAMGGVYEILSWLEDIKYHETGKNNREILDTRIDYIIKGLEYRPEYYILLINAFEAFCIKKDIDKAFLYFNKLKKVDEEIAQQCLNSCPIKEEILEFKGIKVEII